MKNILILLLAAVILGIIAFSAAHWVFRISVEESLNFGMVAALSGFVCELLRPTIERWTKKKSA